MHYKISFRLHTIHKVLLLSMIAAAVGIFSLPTAHAQNADRPEVVGAACTPAPANNFLFLPFDTTTEGDWLVKMSSAFDHDKPNYECSMTGSACSDSTRKIVLWNGDEAKPMPVYSTQSPYPQIGIECYLPGNTARTIRCDGKKGVLGYQSVTVDMGVAAAFYDGHDGYDWGLASGASAKILAAASGRVTKVTDDGLYGKTVTVDHLNGYSTRYSHLNPNNVQVVETGCVAAGQAIGYQGKSGRDDYQIHLHFRVYHGVNLTDPFGYCYECAGSPRDPLIDFNGESSQNLWYGTLPRSVGRAPTRQDLGLVWNAFNSTYLGGPGDPVDVSALTPAPPSTATAPASQNGIEIVSVSTHTVQPGEKFNPSVTVRVTSGTLDPARGDHLHATPEDQSNTMSAWPVQAVKSYVSTGQSYTFNTANDPGFQMTAPNTPGTYQSVWQMRVGGNHIGPQAIIRINVQGPNNPPPSPAARTPGDWSEVHSQQAPELCWDAVSDPNGDPVQYYAEIYQSAVLDNSGWINGTCWRPSNIAGQYFGYQWHVKARDNRGAESGFGNTLHFTLSPPLYDPQQPTTVPQPVNTLPVQTGYSWNSSYLYRRPLTITTNSDLKAGMVIKVDEVNLEILPATWKMRSDHNDLRVVRRLSATTWQEVPRNYYSGWDVEFQLLADIYPGTDTSYYLYYGNPAAGPAPTYSVPSGYYVDMYRDKWWESLGGTWEFNQAMDFNDVCGAPLDHRSRVNSSFDDSDKFRGRLYVPTTGTWTFSVYTNDGYRLALDDIEVGRFDGYDGNRWATIGSIYLKAGWHKMEARNMWVNCGAWKLSMAGPGFGNQIIPASYFQKSWGNVKAGVTASAEESTIPATSTPALPPTAVPTVTPTAPSSTGVRLLNASIADGEWHSKTTFFPGDPIQWILEVENKTGAATQANLMYTIKNPSGTTINSWQGTLTVAAGTQAWGLPGTVAGGAGTYSFSGTVVYRGGITNKSTTYQVNLPPPSFTDVLSTYPYFTDIEILYANGLTGGCSTSPLKFCPDQSMNRGEAAVFMLRANFGSSYVPPAPTHIFLDDWSKGAWAEGWAEGMRKKGLSAGCSTAPLKYCPWDQIPREQAVIFALRMKYGTSYTPPPAKGTVFADMTDTSYYATSWAEQAYQDGLVPNCGMSGGKPKFCPKDLVSRGLAAYMIVRAKNLSMP